MIRPELGVPLATTSTDTRKGLTQISRARYCAEVCLKCALRARPTILRRTALAWVALWFFLPTIARAADVDEAPTRTVVIVFEPHTEAVSQRLRQEIEAMGFEVALQPESAEASSLESLAVAGRAIAAIRVKPLEAGGVEMTVLDRATGKTVHRELARVSAADPACEELVATRTVELFRASLMELGAGHPARGDVRAPEPIEARVH